MASGAADGATMRLDRFLWFIRLAKTRSAAQKIAGEGRLRLDGRAVDRAHANVRVGSVIAFMQGMRVRAIRVEALPARRGPAPEAQACYTDLVIENVSHQASSD
ncbi:MAG: S4 domain-containing protein [Sphingomonas sp.]|jgi:ribosome-associated heat shock protein Hsp15|uniref:RNA-binding S4 domain-containing protein n=1 Tax=Sphingomonas sp. TaxID=28214 RepID=UPI0035627DF6